MSRTLRAWYNRWTVGGKCAVGKSFFTQLAALFRYGILFLEDRDCVRLCGIVDRMKFSGIRAKGHELGYHSIAFAQAIQHELMMRQKDVIGDWVPKGEAKQPSHCEYRNRVWIDGMR
jgi:hypothetical protein